MSQAQTMEYISLLSYFHSLSWLHGTRLTLFLALHTQLDGLVP